MIVRFAEIHHLAVNVLWQETKIASFVPEDPSTSVCLWIRRDHAFFVNDPQTKGVIARMQATRPKMRPSVVQKVASKLVFRRRRAQGHQLQ